jgi:hypothetical protein
MFEIVDDSIEIDVNAVTFSRGGKPLINPQITNRLTVNAVLQCKQRTSPALVPHQHGR